MALEFTSDKEVQELMARVRQTMQQVHTQLNIMEDTLRACEITAEHREYTECVPAVSTAEMEAIKFKDLTAELVKNLDELKNHVMAKHL